MNAPQTHGANLDVRPLAGTIGAAVHGLDLAAIDQKTFAAVRAAWHDRHVLVFPDQDLTPAQQIAFTRMLGPVEPHPLGTRAGIPEHPEILVLENRPGSRGARNDFWHSDISYAARPPMASALYAREVPAGRGDTMWCNMVAAYDGLSEAMRDMLRPLKALHSAELLAQRAAAGDNNSRRFDTPEPATHPVVRTHPESGKKALYTNPAYTTRFADMTAAESAPLLEFLNAQATRSENVYRHQWRAGDLVLWDNRSTMHYAIYDYDDTQPRLMHRTTAAGDVPV
ncbi:MAG: TauD/TfdA family dioxygenase [Alphaproteobacteria bacterium]